eukprot:7470-Eustigmatos_ZCMA.PRE.1
MEISRRAPVDVPCKDEEQPAMSALHPVKEFNGAAAFTRVWARLCGCADWGKEVIKDIGGLNEEQIDNV